jgi:hypothetical protein
VRQGTLHDRWYSLSYPERIWCTKRPVNNLIQLELVLGRFLDDFNSELRSGISMEEILMMKDSKGARQG